MKAIAAIVLLLLLPACLLATVNSDRVNLDASESEIRVLEDGTFELRYYRDVRFEYKGAELLCDTAVYHEARRVLEFWGNVAYEDSIHDLRSNYLKYFERENSFIALGECEIIDHHERVRILGERVDYDRNTDELQVTENPLLNVDYHDPASRIDIECDTLHYDSRSKRGNAVGNVVITKSSMIATCSECMFLPDSNIIELHGEPHARQRQNELSGDTMTIFLKNRLIDRLEVSGNGVATYRKPVYSADSIYTESRIEARHITFLMENELLTSMLSAGNSYSWYTPAPGDTAAEGKNEASGDSILLYFDVSGLSRVQVRNSCVGKFYSGLITDSVGRLEYTDTVQYETANLDYRTADRVIRLIGSSQVKHETVTLTADTITYNTSTRDLRAFSSRKSAPEEEEGTDSVFVPVVLQDGSEEMVGYRLAYNLDSKRGKIKEADTELEAAYYHGELVRKVDEDVLLVGNGRYTTCDLKSPHFHFGSDNMKLISGDKVIARPVVLYIEQIPVFYAPFFVFSVKKGRHSGFLPFRIGTWERGGRYIQDLGYYWAASDYWDLDASMSAEEKIGVKFDANLNYAKRYVMRGTVRGSIARDSRTVFSGRTISTRWSLSANHSHTLSPTASLSGSGTFVSDKTYTTEISNDLNERLNRNLRSQVNFSKRWEQSSLTAAIQSTKNLDDGSSTLTLPEMRFSIGSRVLFPARAEQNVDGPTNRWYNNFRLSYSSNLRNYRSKSSGGTDASRTEYARVTHQSSLSSPQTILKYITVNPSASYNENWFVIFPTNRSEEDSVRSDKVLRSWTSSVSVSARTVLYGYFFPPIPSLLGIRHSATPSISYSLTPKSDLNADEARYAGASSSSLERRVMQVSLSNLFQLKYMSGEEEKKLDLFQLSSSASYDFTEEDNVRWSPLSTSFRTTSIPHVSLQVQTTHYLYNPTTLDFEPLNARLTNLSISSSFSLSGSSGGRPVSPASELEGYQGTPSGPSTARPWNFNLGHRYSESRNITSGAKSITHWITSSANFNMTDNWRVDFSQNYDIRRKVIVNRSITVVRDLHCWEAQFSWNPNGSLKGYYFRIFVKQIPDIKIERSESPLRGTLFN